MKKLLGEQRRQQLVTTLKHSNAPITGTELAKLTNVSRQVIVNDITLLKARNEPIIATSQGYIYITHAHQQYECVVACQHSPKQNEDELLTIVDCGVTVKNVIVEHPLYGEITASLMISNRHDVENFIKRANETSARNLAELTGGSHLHTLSAATEQALQLAVQRIREKGYLIDEK